MHKSCIRDATLSRLQAKAEAQAEAEAVSSTEGKKKAEKGKNVPLLKVEWLDELITGGLVEQGGRSGQFWVEDMHCLGCGGVMR